MSPGGDVADMALDVCGVDDDNIVTRASVDAPTDPRGAP